MHKTESKRKEHYREVFEEIDGLAGDLFNASLVNIDGLTIGGLRVLVNAVNENTAKIVELSRKELRRLREDGNHELFTVL